jgi:hypothetical protein
MTPNEIIHALIEVGSAAFAVQHGASPGASGESIADTEDMSRLREKLAVLDKLPQPAGMPPLTPSAKARYFMQSFLEGQPVQIDGKEFSAAFILAGLGEEVQPPMVAVAAPPRANDGWVIAKETVVELPNGKKELGYTTIHGFPVFTDEQDAHKSHGELKLPLGWVVMRVQQLIPGYVLPEVALEDIEAQQRAVRGFGDPTDAEINEITQFNLGKWPSFEAQSWACKVVHAVAEKLREKDIAAARDKLLADTATEAHRIWNDADLLASLRRLCGYVENGSSESVGISQDDATGEWILRIGPSMSPRVRHFHARSFHQVIRLAADDMLENETCKFCGFEVEFPCDEAPPDICPAAIRAAEKQKRATPNIAAMKPAGPSPEYLAREAMNKLLLELATTYSNRTAKRIILDVGGSQKMKDIPDDKVQAVTIAARDRLAFERRVAELKEAGDRAGLESLLRGQIAAEATAHESKRHGGVEKQMQARVAEVPLFAPGALPQLWSMPIMDPMRLAGMDTSATRPVELPQQDDQVQGQGGEFDGGGASGDFQ